MLANQARKHINIDSIKHKKGRGGYKRAKIVCFLVPSDTHHFTLETSGWWKGNAKDDANFSFRANSFDKWEFISHKGGLVSY